MKKLSQLTINKILITVLILLGIFMIQQKITEQARVDYYICYEQITRGATGYDKEKIKEYCQEYIKEWWNG